MVAVNNEENILLKSNKKVMMKMNSLGFILRVMHHNTFVPLVYVLDKLRCIKKKRDAFEQNQSRFFTTLPVEFHSSYGNCFDLNSNLILILSMEEHPITLQRTAE